MEWTAFVTERFSRFFTRAKIAEAEVTEILRGFWNCVSEESDYDATGGRVINGNVEIDFVGYFGGCRGKSDAGEKGEHENERWKFLKGG
jgi:hypothetical protein